MGEVRCEKKLRESAEQRAGRLSRDVTRLSSEAAMHQAEIAKLSKRLHRVRHSSTKKGQHLESASALTTTLNTKLKVQTENLSRMFEKEKARESGESNAVDATSQGDDVRN